MKISGGTFSQDLIDFKSSNSNRNVTFIEDGIGHIEAWSTPSGLPNNFFECDGTQLDTSEFPELFSSIGYTFGGSGSAFNIPDLRGEFVRGYDRDGVNDPGREFGSLQDYQMQNHTHTMSHFHHFRPVTLQHILGFGGIGSVADAGNGNFTSSDGGVLTGANITVSTSETRPRNVALMYIIRYI